MHTFDSIWRQLYTAQANLCFVERNNQINNEATPQSQKVKQRMKFKKTKLSYFAIIYPSFNFALQHSLIFKIYSAISLINTCVAISFGSNLTYGATCTVQQQGYGT